MPIQPSHHVSSQECQNPDPPPIYRNANARNEPKCRSEAEIRRGGRNKPNFYPAHHPNPRNEPNFIPPRASFLRNEPNFRTPGVSPAFPAPNYTKRTQFPHTKCPATPYLCETNPIPARHFHKTNPILTNQISQNRHKTLQQKKLGQFWPDQMLRSQTPSKTEPDSLLGGHSFVKTPGPNWGSAEIYYPKGYYLLFFIIAFAMSFIAVRVAGLPPEVRMLKM